MTLHNKRIAITRPEHKAADFADQLRARGAVPVLLPTIAIRPVEDPSRLDAALQRLSEYDWTLFTSANAVTQIFARLEALGVSPAFRQVAVVGPVTARALEKRGISVDLIPVEHTATGLFVALDDMVDLRSKRIFLPQANLAQPTLDQLLTHAGALVDAIAAYETVQPDITWQGGADERPLDAITFTSSSTVENFLAALAHPLTKLAGVRVVCIGPITAQTARDNGLTVHAIAEPHTVDGIIAALESLFERTPTS
jgi:uroporphyrinogen-III synthase